MTEEFLKFKMAAKFDRRMNFGKNCQMTVQIIWGCKNFVKITLPHAVSEILKIFFIFIV